MAMHLLSNSGVWSEPPLSQKARRRASSSPRHCALSLSFQPRKPRLLCLPKPCACTEEATKSFGQCGGQRRRL
eukprot:6309561-Pyramimonas_sp.AAC.1